MKGLVIFAVVACLFVVAGYYVMGAYLVADSGELIAFACGNPNGEMHQIQIAIPIAFPSREPPRVDMETGYVHWPEWIDQHYILTTTAGQRVPLVRTNAANLLPDAKVGTPDSYLVGDVKAGVEYQFDFVPSLAEGKHYRRTFTVGSEGVPFRRENFTLVKGK